jgi:hypothetical protein
MITAIKKQITAIPKNDYSDVKGGYGDKDTQDPHSTYND